MADYDTRDKISILLQKILRYDDPNEINNVVSIASYAMNNNLYSSQSCWN